MVGEEHGDFYDSGGCLIGYKEGRFRWRMSRIGEPPMKSDPEERFKIEIDCVQLRQVGKTIKRLVHSSFFLFDKFDNRVNPLLIENAVRSENHQANIGMKPEVRRNLHFSCRETTRFCKVSFELFRRYAKPSAVHRTLVRYRHCPPQALCAFARARGYQRQIKAAPSAAC
jgi:hypothetical protein